MKITHLWLLHVKCILQVKTQFTDKLVAIMNILIIFLLEQHIIHETTFTRRSKVIVITIDFCGYFLFSVHGNYAILLPHLTFVHG